MAGKRDGILLFAHGYADGNGAKLAHRLAAELKERDAFAEITIALSKESPFPDEVLATMSSDRVFIAPLQIGETRVASRMLPEFLTRAPKDKALITLPPVGTMAGVIRLARELIDRTISEAALAPVRTTVLVAAQGSQHEDGAKHAAEALVAGLVAQGAYAEVAVVFQRQEPLAEKWRGVVRGSEIVALPFFISGGHHELKVMPAHLKRGGASLDGSEIDGRRVWRAPSIGEHPGLVELLVEAARASG